MRNEPYESENLLQELLANFGMVLLLGEKEAQAPTWQCLEGIVPFWVEIGSRYETTPNPATLDGYLRVVLSRRLRVRSPLCWSEPASSSSILDPRRGCGRFRSERL